MDEFDLIDRYFRPLATSAGALTLIDDVAELNIRDHHRQAIVTTDALVEGVHFLPSDNLADVAFKLTAVNVSDCLAKGALPCAASLVLAFPHGRQETDIASFASGLGEALRLWRCALLGGDTVSTSGPLLVALTMHGQCVGHRKTVRRTGASAGDDLWVSGRIGDAGLGLLAARGTLFADAGVPDDWSESLTEHVLAAYRRPSLPPSEIARVISAYASASIDISDGLLADADRLARASGVGVRIESERLCLSDAMRTWRQAHGNDPMALAQCLCAGDDYQILLTAPVAVRAAIEDVSQRYGLSRIGRCCSGDRAHMYAQGQRIEVPRLGWRHIWHES